jgi:hypothetical protein
MLRPISSNPHLAMLREESQLLMTSPRALEDTTMMGTTIKIVVQLELADEHNVEELCGLTSRGLGV